MRRRQIVRSLVTSMARSLALSTQDLTNPYTKYLTHYSSFAGGRKTATVGTTITVARSQTGSPVSYVDGGTGLVTFVAQNTARVEAEGVLIEQASTNQLTYSNDMSNAVWTKTNCSRAAVTAGAPDGASDANRITVTANGVAAVYAPTASVNSRSLSFWAKANGSATAMSVAQSGAVLANFTLTSSWRRYIFEATAGDGTGYISLYLHANAAAGSATAGDSFDIAFVQAEAADTVSSYILTTSAATTRNADQYSMTLADIPAPNAAHTIAMTFDSSKVDSNQRRLICSRGTTQEESMDAIHTSGTAKPRLIHGLTGGGTDAVINTAAFTAKTSHRVVASFDPTVTTYGTIYISMDGATPVTKARSGNTTGSRTTLELGHRAGANQLNGHIKELKIYNVAIPTGDYKYA